MIVQNNSSITIFSPTNLLNVLKNLIRHLFSHFYRPRPPLGLINSFGFSGGNRVIVYHNCVMACLHSLQKQEGAPPFLPQAIEKIKKCARFCRNT